MVIIDAMLHEPPVSLRWQGVSQATRWDLLLELQLSYMDAVGVDRVVLHPLELAWGEYAVRRCPDRFTLVPMFGVTAAEHGGIDPRTLSVDELISARGDRTGLAGIRIVRSERVDWLDEFESVLEACARTNLPVFVYTTGDLTAPATIAQRHPDLTVIIDHLGLPRADRKDDPPFRDLPRLLDLAAFDNIAVKLSGAPAMTDQPYPFEELWPHLRLMIDTFGPHRLMWGTDMSRLMGSVGFHYSTGRRSNHTYAEALMYLRDSVKLSATEKAWILGGTAERLLPWPDN